MRNAHLRLGQLEYLRSTVNIQTRIRLQVDRYMGEEADGHLLSLYCGDAEIGAIAAAIHEKHPFTLTFPTAKARQSAWERMHPATAAAWRSPAANNHCVIWSLFPKRFMRTEQQGRPTCSITSGHWPGRHW